MKKWLEATSGDFSGSCCRGYKKQLKNLLSFAELQGATTLCLWRDDQSCTWASRDTAISSLNLSNGCWDGLFRRSLCRLRQACLERLLDEEPMCWFSAKLRYHRCGHEGFCRDHVIPTLPRSNRDSRTHSFSKFNCHIGMWPLRPQFQRAEMTRLSKPVTFLRTFCSHEVLWEDKSGEVSAV